MSFVLLPIALIDGTVSMYELASAFSHVVFPIALILGSIWPDLSAIAMPLMRLIPLAAVNGAVVKYMLFFKGKKLPIKRVCQSFSH
jgi:hypothetical protein